VLLRARVEGVIHGGDPDGRIGLVVLGEGRAGSLGVGRGATVASKSVERGSYRCPRIAPWALM